MATTKKATKKAATRRAGESRSEAARRKGPATYDRLKKKQARTADVPVYLDDDLASEVEELQRQVEKDRLYMARVRGNGGEDAEREARLAEREQRLEEARDELGDATIWMRFQAVGRKRYEDLLAEHPPTDEQKAEAKDNDLNPPEFNVDTFPAALVAVACVEPDDLAEGAYLDEDEGRTRYPRVEEIFDEWNADEIGAVFRAAWEVNTRRRTVDLGKG